MLKKQKWSIKVFLFLHNERQKNDFIRITRKLIPNIIEALGSNNY
jgi:hypothetical protein